MVLTAKAEALKPRLARLIAEIQSVVDLPQTPLAALQQTVRLSLADYPCAIRQGLDAGIMAVADCLKIVGRDMLPAAPVVIPAAS